MIEFEWSVGKARSNLAKHGVDFETATAVFSDPFALAEPDLTSLEEERWRTIGLVNGVLLLLVAHTMQDDDGVEVIRIISARRAEPKERKRYEQETR